MHRTKASVAILLLVGATTASGQSPPKIESSGVTPLHPLTQPRGDFAAMMCYEPTGLCLLRPVRARQGPGSVRARVVVEPMLVVAT